MIAAFILLQAALQAVFWLLLISLLVLAVVVFRTPPRSSGSRTRRTDWESA